MDRIQLNLATRTIRLYGSDGKTPALTGQLGVGIPNDLVPDVICDDGGRRSVEWKATARLDVEIRDDASYVITWESLSRDVIPTDAYELTEQFWYGGPEAYEQRWPINKQTLPMQQFVTNDYLTSKECHSLVGPIADPYWFNSQGAAIYVPSAVPLHVGFNESDDGLLRLRADFSGTTDARTPTDKLVLTYTICLGEDARDVHRRMAASFLPRPTGLPDERMFRAPVWSSWARYREAVTQRDIMSYADEIARHGFPHSQIEIDDKFTTAYGQFDFDREKFPDPVKMVDDLHSRGFRVTAWITPFANLDSQAFKEGMERGFWLRDAKARVPALVKWWQGVGAILDVTNPEATKWYVERLKKFQQEYKLDSFKFDAGEIFFLPLTFYTHAPLASSNYYTRFYADVVAQFGDAVEMRSAFRTQHQPMYVRMMDKDSVWSHRNGLRSLIPTALMMSITGYHFILPDMIGGNGYDFSDPPVTFPSRELFVRWMQLSAYLPAMQFSFSPWQYDDEVVAIAKKTVSDHETRVAPIFLKATEEMLKDGTPIIRPLWWLAPRDEDALACDTQFLVAGDILVAPLLEEGGRTRDIYIPAGRWRDDMRDGIVVGPLWLRGYKAELKDIPTFTRLDDAE